MSSKVLKTSCVSAAAVVVAGFHGTAWACSVCAGDPASPMTAGMNSAITALLLITGTVLSTFVGFFIYLWRRARQVRRTQFDTAWLEGLRGAKNV